MAKGKKHTQAQINNVALAKHKASARYRGKYHIYTRKKTKKERLSSAAARGINTGVTSGLLTGALNTGKGKWKSAGKFGLFLGGAVAGLDYLSTRKGRRNKKTFVKKADYIMKKAFWGAAAKVVSKGAKKILPKSWVGKGTLGAEILQPGAAIARRAGVKTKPNILDDILFFGAPITAGMGLGAATKGKPKKIKGGVTSSTGKSDWKKKDEIKRYGRSSASYDRGAHGQKLMH